MNPIPTDTLRAVHAREWKARRWPESFDACAADPVISRIMDVLARHVPAYSRRDVDRARIGWNGPVRVTTSAAPTPAPNVIDNKRRASGEKPEDYE